VPVFNWHEIRRRRKSEVKAIMHHYKGTWQTVKEDGVYKMLKSKILEVENPGWNWFYE